MLINYVTPTEEELFKKYNPDLQRRSLEGREQRLKEANDFIAHLKEMGKSDKPCMCGLLSYFYKSSLSGAQ